MGATVPKQYLPLAGRPVISTTLERLCGCAQVRGVMVGISAGDAYWSSIKINSAKFLGTFNGGASRAHTVLNGLLALTVHAGSDDWVMVHDAVRPCVRVDDMELLISTVIKGKNGGLLGLPVADTMKRVNASAQVVETVLRENLWRALTPQLFYIAELKDALQRALAQNMEITDEAAAIEAAGGHPIMVKGHPDNIKITVPEDLALAELFLKQQERS